MEGIRGGLSLRRDRLWVGCLLSWLWGKWERGMRRDERTGDKRRMDGWMDDGGRWTDAGFFFFFFLRHLPVQVQFDCGVHDTKWILVVGKLFCFSY